MYATHVHYIFSTNTFILTRILYAYIYVYIYHLHAYTHTIYRRTTCVGATRSMTILPLLSARNGQNLSISITSGRKEI